MRCGAKDFAGKARHREERSDEAIQPATAIMDCFAFGSQ
jgi:hypothetical protein